jgi:hypothetical protein
MLFSECLSCRDSDIAPVFLMVMSSGFYYKTADGLTLRAQNKREPLAISPTIVFSVHY